MFYGINIGYQPCNKVLCMTISVIFKMGNFLI
jgi:hypothetical protein